MRRSRYPRNNAGANDGGGFYRRHRAQAKPASERSILAPTAIDPQTEPNVGKVIRRHVGRGVDLALEFVGRVSVEVALGTLDTGGCAVVVGVGSARLLLVSFIGREFSVIGSFGMDKRDIVDLLALIARGHDLSRSVTQVYPLADINKAQSAGKQRCGVVRLVVEPGC